MIIVRSTLDNTVLHQVSEVAQLKGRDLTCADLHGLDLSHVYWPDAKMVGANLFGANLEGADLRRADLAATNLSCARLANANLFSVNLKSAYLYRTYLSGADLEDANLANTNMSMADLRAASLRDADLAGARLDRALLEDADLQGASIDEGLLRRKQIVPAGTIIGWKKLGSRKICKLQIPASAPRVGGVIGRKCRAQRAKVLGIWCDDVPQDYGHSMWDLSFVYRKGETVQVHNWCDDMRVECAPGIHFFLTREEAEDYEL